MTLPGDFLDLGQRLARRAEMLEREFCRADLDDPERAAIDFRHEMALRKVHVWLDRAGVMTGHSEEIDTDRYLYRLVSGVLDVRPVYPYVHPDTRLSCHD